jgi:hypothetical protein
MAREKIAPAAGGLRLEWRTPQELAENPRNWRRHPEAQMDALSEAISEVGWAGACLYNETTGRLLDGHARRKLALEQGCERVPVLVGSWSEEQERLILASLDPLAAMAEAGAAELEALLAEVTPPGDALQKMLDDLAAQAPACEEGAAAEVPPDAPTIFEVTVSCSGEAQQKELYDRLSAEGLSVRVLTL